MQKVCSNYSSYSFLTSILLTSNCITGCIYSLMLHFIIFSSKTLIYTNFHLFNFLLALFLCLHGGIGVKFSEIQDLIPDVLIDYAIIREYFFSLEKCYWYESVLLLGLIMLLLDYSYSHVFTPHLEKIAVFGVILYQTFSIATNDLIFLTLGMLFLQRSYGKDLSAEKIFLISILYFIDLLVNYNPMKIISIFENHSKLFDINSSKIFDINSSKSVEFTFCVIGIYTTIALSFFLTTYARDAMPQSFFLTTAIIFTFSYFYDTYLSSLEKIVIPSAIFAALAGLALSILSRNTTSSICFPPKEQSIEDFIMHSLTMFIEKTPADKIEIRVRKSKILPRSDSTEFVNLSVINFKLISSLHIFNLYFREIQRPFCNFEKGISNKFSKFNITFPKALEKSKSHFDILDRDIENAIISVINKPSASFLDGISLGNIFSFFRISQSNNDRLIAERIERNIEEGNLENFVSYIFGRLYEESTSSGPTNLNE